MTDYDTTNSARWGNNSAICFLDDDQAVLKVPDDRELFLRESQALSELHDNQHIVRLTHIDRERRILVLDYAPGESLAHILRYSGEFSEQEANQVVAQVAEVLAYMHEYQNDGYVHYDLTPGNIMWEKETADVTVIDFGTAYKLSDIPKEYHSKLIGTPLYVSPEKLEMNPTLGKQSDIYALGAIWYELVTGAPPFNPALGNIRSQIMNGQIEPPREVTQEVGAMIMKMLARDPSQRPSARELIQFLAPALE